MFLNSFLFRLFFVSFVFIEFFVPQVHNISSIASFNDFGFIYLFVQFVLSINFVLLVQGSRFFL